MFYGRGGSYALFEGKDASRALAKMSFEEKDLTGDISGLGMFELDALRDWEYKFMSKYAKVGTIKTPETALESSTADQPVESSATQPAETTTDEPAESTAAQPAEATPAQNADHVVAADNSSENAVAGTKEESSTTSEANKEE